MRGAFPGACRMFVDFPSSALARREMHVISSFLLEQFGGRNIKPVASIKGAHGSSTSSSAVGKSKTVKDQDCCKAFCVWVGNLPRLVDVKEIHALFAECGRIHGITRHQGDGRTSAFIKFETWASACSGPRAAMGLGPRAALGLGLLSWPKLAQVRPIWEASEHQKPKNSKCF